MTQIPDGDDDNFDAEFDALFDRQEMVALTNSLSPIFKAHGIGVVDHGLAEAERQRVTALLRRDRVNAPRIDLQAKLKRWGETHDEWQMRLANMSVIERPIGEPLTTPEAEQHAEYRDEFVTHVESNTKSQVKRRQSQSSIERMGDKGQLTPEQVTAAEEIVSIVELIEGTVGIRSGNLEPRVDCSGHGKGMLIESIGRVRLEATYSAWRNQLPIPRRMVLDMLLSPRPLVATARVHNVPWRVARKRLLHSLDLWVEFRERMLKQIDDDDVGRVYRKLGEGSLRGK